MAVPLASRRYTILEYLEMERAAETRHEYHDGEIFAMAGGSFRHALVIGNVGGEVRSALKGKPCRAYASDLKIGIPSERRFVYPDVSVICGEPVSDANDPNSETAINPTVIIEVLSPSTERYDRTQKFEYYRSLVSLREYVLVASDELRVETFFRQTDGTWAFQSWTSLEASIVIRSLSIAIPAAEVYAGVEFDLPVSDVSNG